MRRLAAMLLVILGVVGAFAGLALLGKGATAAGASLLFFGISAGVAGWWMDRNKGQTNLANLPEPAGDYRATINRGAVVGIAVLIALLLWMAASAGLLSLHVPQPFLWGLLVALAAPLPFVLRMIGIDTGLRVDARGVEHHRYGRIPWNDVEGIRMRAVTVKGQTKYFFELRVRDPERYLQRASWIQRLALRRQKVLGISLQFLNAEPLALFEASTRYRSAVQPPAITGWEGDVQRSVAVSQAMLAGVPTSSTSTLDSPEHGAHRRLFALSMAMSGGWSSVDTREMADQRIEAKRLRTRLDEAEGIQMDQGLRQMIDANPTPDLNAFDALRRRVQADSAQTADGQRLEKLEASLRETTGNRRRRQQLWTWATIGGIGIAYLWLKLHR